MSIVIVCEYWAGEDEFTLFATLCFHMTNSLTPLVLIPPPFWKRKIYSPCLAGLEICSSPRIEKVGLWVDEMVAVCILVDPLKNERTCIRHTTKKFQEQISVGSKKNFKYRSQQRAKLINIYYYGWQQGAKWISNLIDELLIF